MTDGEIDAVKVSHTISMMMTSAMIDTPRDTGVVNRHDFGALDWPLNTFLHHRSQSLAWFACNRAW